MRATYKIMSQNCDDAAEMVYSATRKKDAERFFNGLYRDFSKNEDYFTQWENLGYFTVILAGYCDIKTHYWIIKSK